jgi:hypothetical protein
VHLEQHGCGASEALQMRPINPFSDDGDALSIATATSDAELLLSLSE